MKLLSLQIGRAIAALMVVLFHLNGSIWGMEKYFPEKFSALFGFGHSGVQFFFVLSGFIIFYIHWRDIDRASTLYAFLFKRLVRVFPAYWVVLFALIPIYFLIPGMGGGPPVTSQIITSIFLLPYPQDPILSVGWTLKHEILFYILFGLWIANKWIGSTVLILWQVACFVALGFEPLAFPLSFFLSPNNLLFGLGIVVAYLTIAKPPPIPALLGIFGVFLFLMAGLHEVYSAEKYGSSIYLLMYGGASALAVLGIATLEQAKALPIPRLLVHLGDASYATYLVHFPLLAVFAKLIFALRLEQIIPNSLLFIALFCLVVAAGSVFHLLIERPMMAALRSRQRPAAMAESGE